MQPWTGSLIKHEGRIHLFYTMRNTQTAGAQQRIGLATSRDMMTWQRHPGNPIIEPDPRWYVSIGKPDPGGVVDCRDLIVLPDPEGPRVYRVLLRADSGRNVGRGLGDRHGPIARPGALGATASGICAAQVCVRGGARRVRDGRQVVHDLPDRPRVREPRRLHAIRTPRAAPCTPSQSGPKDRIASSRTTTYCSAATRRPPTAAGVSCSRASGICSAPNRSPAGRRLFRSRSWSGRTYRVTCGWLTRREPGAGAKTFCSTRRESRHNLDSCRATTAGSCRRVLGASRARPMPEIRQRVFKSRISGIRAEAVEIEARVQLESGVAAGFAFGPSPGGRSRDLVLMMDAQAGCIRAGRRPWFDDPWARQFPVERGRPYQMRVMIRPPRFEVFMDDILVLQAAMRAPQPDFTDSSVCLFVDRGVVRISELGMYRLGG